MNIVPMQSAYSLTHMACRKQFDVFAKRTMPHSPFTDFQLKSCRTSSWMSDGMLETNLQYQILAGSGGGSPCLIPSCGRRSTWRQSRMVTSPRRYFGVEETIRYTFDAINGTNYASTSSPLSCRGSRSWMSFGPAPCMSPSGA